jgi:hypothetical protein
MTERGYSPGGIQQEVDAFLDGHLPTLGGARPAFPAESEWADLRIDLQILPAAPMPADALEWIQREVDRLAELPGASEDALIAAVEDKIAWLQTQWRINWRQQVQRQFAQALERAADVDAAVVMHDRQVRALYQRMEIARSRLERTGLKLPPDQRLDEMPLFSAPHATQGQADSEVEEPLPSSWLDWRHMHLALVAVMGVNSGLGWWFAAPAVARENSWIRAVLALCFAVLTVAIPLRVGAAGRLIGSGRFLAMGTSWLGLGLTIAWLQTRGTSTLEWLLFGLLYVSAGVALASKADPTIIDAEVCTELESASHDFAAALQAHRRAVRIQDLASSGIRMILDSGAVFDRYSDMLRSEAAVRVRSFSEAISNKSAHKVSTIDLGTSRATRTSDS